MTKKKNKSLRILLPVLLIVALVAAGLYAYNLVRTDVAGERGSSAEYTLVIEDNDFAYEIGAKLKNAGMIKSDTVWTWWMDRNYPDFTYYNGEYYLNAGMSYQDLAEKLQNPDISHKKVKVTIPEGYTVFDIASTLEKKNVCSAKDFLKACSTTEGYDYDWLADFPKNDPHVGYILEGFLFPATYDFGENSKAADIADAMLEAFDQRITDEVKTYCKQRGYTLYQFVTLCSIVQKEALSKSSQGNIASTLENRLDKGMKIECDVTYYYAKALRDHGFSQSVYDAYYTYRCPGLPAGPIANPGTEIMTATVEHPSTDYLYFFSDLKGNFHFAATYGEFESLKAKYPWK